MGDERRYTRRRALALAGAVAGTALSGCLGGGADQETATEGDDGAAGGQTTEGVELSRGELNQYAEAAADGSWPVDSYDASNTFSNQRGNGPGESVRKAWERGFSRVTRPVVADGRVFVGTKRQDSSGGDRWECKAFDAATGEQQWTTEVQDDEFVFPTYHDGSVYYFDDGGVKAVDPSSGDEQWHVASSYGNLVHADETLYVVSGRYSLNEVYLQAIDTESQEIRWEKSSEEVALTDRAGLADDGTIVAAGVESLRAFDGENGEEVWKRTYGEEDAPVDVSVAGDVALFTHGFEAGTPAVDAVRWKTDEQLWTYSDADIIPEMAVADGRVYVGRDAEPGVAAVDLETGERIDDWTPDVGAAATYMAPGNARPRVAGGTVYQWTKSSSMEGSLHAIDAESGAVHWTHDGELGYPPAIVDGSLFYRETMSTDRLIALTAA